ncbi:MAG: 30S ribosomal protein S27ae [Acidilobaceae archaeon]|nr:30S ribosomal protein S27ae [Acidilobaceae archaeon]MCX8166193.1 30S ribosomal protein S27ae [Acidilobaceae archaeon]MDW7974831.1 30S ribosomal protein S27ae [Sulfolobales archaeon]
MSKAKELKTYVHKLYVIDEEKKVAKLKNKRCPRCGSVMAHHVQGNERWHCGKCGYTEFIVKAAPQQPKEKRPERQEKKKK